MKNWIGISLVIWGLFSCQRVSETKNEKKYVGNWSLTEMEVFRYDNVGNVDSSGTVSLAGEMVFTREVNVLTYTMTGQELIDVFALNGDWDVMYFGKPHVLLIGKLRCPVDKVKDNELVFSQTSGDGTGKMKYKRIFHFKK